MLAHQGRSEPVLFKNLFVFSQNVSVKFPDPMLSVYLEYFIIKNEMQMIAFKEII